MSSGRPALNDWRERPIEACARHLDTHFPGQRSAWTTPGEIRAAYAVAREAERVRAIRLSLQVAR